MIEKLKSTIKEYDLLPDFGEVLVALSGGADSTALLLGLRELGYKVKAVHVNHNLRGEESDCDQSFCRDLCSRLDIPLIVESVDVRGYSEANKLSTEEAARDLRYAAIRRSADCPIATAHNLNDCFETTLFNLVRGTSLGGLLGIPPKRDDIIRPLINVTREEIISYLKLKNQPWVEDSTNKVADCTRNIIRLEIVPKLIEINHGLYKTYKSFLSTVGEARDYIDSSVDEVYNDNLQGKSLNFTNIPEGALRSNAIAKHLRLNGIGPTADRIRLILEFAEKDTKIILEKGIQAVITSGRLTIVRDCDLPKKQCFEVDLTEDFRFGEKLVKITRLSQFDISAFNRQDLYYTVDSDKLRGIILARSTSGCEKVSLQRSSITQMVKKLLASRASAQDRPKQLILSDDGGVFFVEGYGIDKRVCCDEKTTHPVKIDII